MVACALAAMVAGCVDAGTWPDIEPYCSAGGPTRPVRGGSGPAREDLCRTVAERVCDQWARCGCDDGSGTIDVGACVLRIGDACAAIVGSPDIIGALARGTLVWSGSEAAAFVTALETAASGCDPIDVDVSMVAIGSLPSHAPCTAISGAFNECSDGTSCELYWGGGPRGEPPGYFCALEPGSSQGLGQACDGYANQGCRPGLRCAPLCNGDQFEGVCTDLLALGEECRWDRDCASELCHLDLDSSSYPYDYRGRCAERASLADGAPCTSYGDCESGYCEYGLAGVSSRPNIPVGSCAPLRVDGSDCASGSQCASGHCSGFRRVDINTCTDTGEACTADSECACVLGAWLGTCGAGAAVGMACRDSSECASGYCNLDESGVCEAPSVVGLGEPCGIGVTCGEGTCFWSECTLLLRAEGEPCALPEECATRSCVGGACAPAVCTARIDPGGAGPHWWRSPALTPR